VNERPKWGSDRTIGLPPETSFVLEALRAQRQRQRLERIAAGSGWSATLPLKTEGGITVVDNDLVFTTTAGRPLSGAYIDEGPFREVCRKAGITHSTRERKGLRFHDLRHSAATILLAAGVPERVVTEILGPLDACDGEALPARPPRSHGRRDRADGPGHGALTSRR